MKWHGWIQTNVEFELQIQTLNNYLNNSIVREFILYLLIGDSLGGTTINHRGYKILTIRSTNDPLISVGWYPVCLFQPREEWEKKSDSCLLPHESRHLPKRNRISSFPPTPLLNLWRRTCRSVGRPEMCMEYCTSRWPCPSAGRPAGKLYGASYITVAPCCRGMSKD
jgi:hypothetical protein